MKTTRYFVAALLIACSGSRFTNGANKPSTPGEAGGGTGGALIEEAGAPPEPGAGGAASTERVCVPGATQDCSVPGRCQGAQVCRDDGSSWGPCECAAGSGGSTAGAAGSMPSAGQGVGGSAAGVGGEATGGMGAAAGTGGVASSGPPVLLLMVDRSSSSDFEVFKSALASFFEAPPASSFAVGLRLFPDDNPVAGCSSPACSDAACSHELVDVGFLTQESAPTDAQESALMNVVANTYASAPGSGRPVSSALAGGLSSVPAVSAALRTTRIALVLVASGDPIGCDPSAVTLAATASDAYATGTQTYVLTTAPSGTLDAIARGGGTDAARDLGTGADAVTALGAALLAIRDGL